MRLVLILAAGVLAMSSASIFIRLAQAEAVPSIVIAAYRLGIASAAMSIPAARQQVWHVYAKLNMRSLALLVLSGIFMGLHFAAWITSLAHTSVVSSLVLVTTTPLWLGIASPLILGEKTPRNSWIGIAFAIVGGAVIGASDWGGALEGSTWGNLLALSGAILMAGTLVISRRVRDNVPLVAYLWIVYVTAGILLVIWSLFSGFALTGYSLTATLWMIALGLIPQLIGHTAANYAVRHVSATLVAVSILGEPIGSTLLAILVLQEWPTAIQLVGSVLILAGIAIVSLAENPKIERQPTGG